MKYQDADIKRLKQGAEVWNQWHAKSENAVAEFNFTELEDLDLSGYNLRRADFTESTLRRCQFRGAKLDDADLSFSTIEDCDFTAASMVECAMGECRVERTSFAKTMLPSALLGGTRFQGVDFTQAVGLYASFDKVVARKTKFAKSTFSIASFRDADLARCNLRGASLAESDFTLAKLAGANLRDVFAERANFDRADLTRAKLSKAILIEANFKAAVLTQCDLEGANLIHADLNGADLRGADLSACLVHGVAAWNVDLDKQTLQKDLLISAEDEAPLTVDDIEVAQFIYLLSNNAKIRNMLETITSKAVLILGRFTPERKAVLDGLRASLRQHGYVPIVFDFEKASSRDFTETVKVLAGLCAFIVADITQPKSSPLELQATVPDYMIPFVPIIKKGEDPFSMFRDLRQKYDWVLAPLEYTSKTALLKAVKRGIIGRAMNKQAELLSARAQELKTESAADYADG